MEQVDKHVFGFRHISMFQIQSIYTLIHISQSKDKVFKTFFVSSRHADQPLNAYRLFIAAISIQTFPIIFPVFI